MGDLFAKNARNSQLHKRLKEEVEAEIRPMSYEGADLTECVARILALFAPVLAEKERAERNRDMWKGQCERQAKTLFDLRMQMLADEGQSRAGIDGWHEQIQRDASIDSPLNACCYRDQCKAMEARALAAEAALAAERANAVDGSIDIRRDDKGGIDEIFGNGVLCHIERMNKGEWFVIMARPDQSQEAFWLTGKGKVEFTLHEHREAPTTGPNVEPWTIAAAIRAQGE